MQKWQLKPKEGYISVPAATNRPQTKKKRANQRQPRTTNGASKAFNPWNTVIDRQGNCGSLTAADGPTSADNKGNAAVLATDKSTSNTVPIDDSD